MIFMYAESHLSPFTFIFYACIWTPLLWTTRSFLRILSFIHNPHPLLSGETPSCNLDLPVSCFRHSECRKGNKGEAEHEEDELCSICLVEFEDQDLVNELGRCGHTFHAECMDKWLETCQFTCPLCRSFLLKPTPPCNRRLCDLPIIRRRTSILPS